MGKSLFALLLGGAACALTACGGGGGGGGGSLVSTPPPPTGVLPPPEIGLVSSAPFAVVAVETTYTESASGSQSLLSGPAPQAVQFSYNAATDSYQIDLPSFEAGRLANTMYSGTWGQVAIGSTSQVTAGASNTLQPVFVTLPVPGTEFSPYT